MGFHYDVICSVVKGVTAVETDGKCLHVSSRGQSDTD